MDSSGKDRAGSPFLAQRQLSARSSPATPSEFAEVRSSSLAYSPSAPVTSSLTTQDSHLFDTPNDLVCPITCELFMDPVINSLGQVYERTAIERHLARSQAASMPPKDPVTNVELESTQLVTVYPMRSRAAEFREKTARACVEAAISPSCTQPVRYLRRAAELLAPQVRAASAASGAAAGQQDSQQQQQQSLIPGISRDFADFLANHQGGAYDAMALKYFGNELLRAGACDAAADVFYRLLLEADDRQQQSEYLQLCLACWASTNSRHHTCSHPAGTPPAASSVPGQQPSSCNTSGSSSSQEGSEEAEVDDEVINKLAAFVERQQCLSMGSIIDMLATAKVGHTAGLRLCNTLLLRAVAGTGPLAASVEGFPKVIDLLLRCIQLNQQRAQRQVQQLAERVDGMAAAAAAAAPAAAEPQAAVEAAAAAEGSAGSAPSIGAVAAGGAQEASSRGVRTKAQQQRRQQGKGKPLQVVGAALRSKPAKRLATAALTAASLLGQQQLAWRVARLAPLLLLLSN